MAWVLSTSYFSDQHTARFILPLLKWVFPHESMPSLLFWHKVIRKAAHVFVYFVLSLLLYRSVRGDRAGWQLRWALVAVTIAACYAFVDEGHQFFVPGRNVSLRDVLLDTCSAGLAQMAMLWFPRRPLTKASPPDAVVAK